MGEQPGVFGWLIMRNLVDSGGCMSAEPLTSRRRALTVGVYDDTTKSEAQEPCGDRASGVVP